MHSSPATMALANTLLVAPARSVVDRRGEIAQRWMEMVLGDKLAAGFPVALLSGEALCALANRVFLALGMRDHKCVQTHTFWPAAAHVASPRPEGGAGRSASGDGERGRERGSSSGDLWLQQKRFARQNVEEYLRACITIGVSPQDCFQPDDLLELLNLDKVYRNILALQNVSVSISHRRSIGDRSSIGASQSWTASPVRAAIESVNSMRNTPRFGGQEAPTTEGRNFEEGPQPKSWQELLTQYETQQLRNAATDANSKDASTVEGLGQLAHALWRTEEQIRTVLLSDVADDVVNGEDSTRPQEQQGSVLGTVPEELHGKLWLLTSGAAMEIRQNEGQYDQYVEMETGSESTEATRQIDADLHRTVPDSDKHKWSDEKTQMMRRVLVAYSFYNPTLGYCQGLNYVVARLLLFVGEEEAFFLLIKMIGLVPDDYYTSMLGLAVDQQVFADLVRLQTPDIVEHLMFLGGSGMELSLACTEWFLTLFSSPCDIEVTMRLWDTMFILGDEILFRVALALMQSEKAALLGCNTYGDMLKHLNEIGRGTIDTLQLMKDSWQQDQVARTRIEDFRAHHRLQLATGIAVSSIEAEEANDNTTDGGGSSKGDPKIKLFSKKRQGLFKHVDKTAGRDHESFDRHLTEEYIETIRKEYPTFSCYYDGRAPMIFDEYWGSAQSYNQWGKKNYRRIIEPESTLQDDKTDKDDRRRLQSDSIGIVESKYVEENLSGSYGSGRGFLKPQPRERRSKSSAFISTKKNTHHSSDPNLLQGKKVGNDPPLSRSPKGWLQRWKEKKNRQRMLESPRTTTSMPSNSLVNAFSSSDLYPSRERPYNKTFTAPAPWRGSDRHDSVRGTSFDGRQTSRTKSTNSHKNSDIAEELSLAKSHSESFLSPNNIYARPSWDDSEPNGVIMDSEIIMRSQEMDKSEFLRPSGRERTSSSHKRERGDHDDDEMLGRSSGSQGERPFRLSETPAPGYSSPPLGSSNAGKPPAPRTPDWSSLSLSPVASAAAASSLGVHRSSTPLVIKDLRDLRTTSDDFDDSGLRDLMNLVAPAAPSTRRNHSLPLRSDGTHAPRHAPPPHHPHYLQSSHHTPSYLRNGSSRKMTSDTARVIRERAQVLSYVQRKASDASSVTGSFPRSPRERERSDMGRLSGSSSGSSRLSEFTMPPSTFRHGHRFLNNGNYPSAPGSVKSVASSSATARKGSISFFEKLSLDMGSHLDDIHGSFADRHPRREPDPLLGSSTWSPGSANAHLSALSAAAAAASPSSSSFYSK